MGDFQLWKLDLMEAWAAMYLTMADYQSTVNHLIVNRLDSDLQATLIDISRVRDSEAGGITAADPGEAGEPESGGTEKGMLQFSQAADRRGPGRIQRPAP